MLPPDTVNMKSVKSFLTYKAHWLSSTCFDVLPPSFYIHPTQLSVPWGYPNLLRKKKKALCHEFTQTSNSVNIHIKEDSVESGKLSIVSCYSSHE